MAKKVNTSMWLAPRVQSQLKSIAAQWDMSVGEVIEGLVDFAAAGKYITDANFIKRFDGLYEVAMLNAGIDASWQGTPEEEEHEKKMVKRRAAYEKYLEARDRGRKVAELFKGWTGENGFPLDPEHPWYQGDKKDD